MMIVCQRAQKAKKNKLGLYDLALTFQLLCLGWILKYTNFLLKETDQKTLVK